MCNKNIFISGIIILIFFVLPSAGIAQTDCPNVPNCIFADLAITAMDLPDPITAGQNLTYQVTATNYGPQSSQDVVVTMLLPSVVAFVSAPSGCTEAGGTITCNVGTIGGGASVLLEIVVHVDPAASGYIACAAAIQSITPGEVDPFPANNTTNVETFVVGPVLAISINDTGVTEPDAATADALFTVQLSEPSSFEITVDYATADGTAAVGQDYMETHGTLTFPPDTTELQIAVPVLADAEIMENEETFFVNLTNATFAVISDPQGIGTIQETCLFCDHFDDNVLRVDWTYSKPCWSESGHNLIGSPCAGRRTNAIANPVFEGLSGAGIVEATMQSSGGPGNKLWLLAWYQNKKNTVELIMREESNAWILKQKSNGKVVAKKKVRFPIEPNVKYDVEIVCDGYTIKFYVNEELLTEMIYGAPVSGTVGFKTKDTVGKFDKIYVNNNIPY